MMTETRLRERARASGAAADRMERTNPEQSFQYRMDQAYALGDLGGLYGDEEAMRHCVEIFRTEAPRFSPELDLEGWVAIMSCLATSLYRRGLVFETGSGTLLEAIDLYRLVISVGGESRTLLQNLANALYALATRDRNFDREMEAVEALDRAAAAWDSRPPVQEWAALQETLGMLLWQVWEADRGRANALKGSAQGFACALQFYNERETPLQWAVTLNRFAATLYWLGYFESDLESLRAAREAVSDSLRVFRADTFPDQHSAATVMMTEIETMISFVYQHLQQNQPDPHHHA
ncbi:hypothetical protein IHV25_04520 [Phaeovibrio sulfidiphilus]|uniref:Uncharacterized protein n=1 Tax=Phaeovibrio sulfidiphilus TaxID=1220600 RepID=A0A8J6YLE8_9PROT|nr:hypothetical protein [Phaeovibrio sulfidiphilus]MBE1236910.1 hypothetical protein [Phaeovibrio sulfidiphilus]